MKLANFSKFYRREVAAHDAAMRAPMPAPTLYKGERATVGDPHQRYRDWITKQTLQREQKEQDDERS